MALNHLTNQGTISSLSSAAFPQPPLDLAARSLFLIDDSKNPALTNMYAANIETKRVTIAIPSAYATSVGDVVSTRPSDGKLVKGFGPEYLHTWTPTTTDSSGTTINARNTGGQLMSFLTTSGGLDYFAFACTATSITAAGAGVAAVFVRVGSYNPNTKNWTFGVSPADSPVSAMPSGTQSCGLGLVAVGATCFVVSVLGSGGALQVAVYTVNLTTRAVTRTDIQSAGAATVSNTALAIRSVVIDSSNPAAVMTISGWLDASNPKNIHTFAASVNSTTGLINLPFGAIVTLPSAAGDNGAANVGNNQMWDIRPLGNTAGDPRHAIAYFDSRFTSATPRVRLYVASTNLATKVITNPAVGSVANVVVCGSNLNAGLAITLMSSTTSNIKLLLSFSNQDVGGMCCFPVNINPGTFAITGPNGGALPLSSTNLGTNQISYVQPTASTSGYNGQLVVSSTLCLVGYNNASVYNNCLAMRLVRINADDTVATDYPVINCLTTQQGIFNSVAYGSGGRIAISCRDLSNDDCVVAMATSLDSKTGKLTMDVDVGFRGLGIAQDAVNPGDSCSVAVFGPATVSVVGDLVPGNFYWLQSDGSVSADFARADTDSDQPLSRGIALSTTQLMLGIPSL